MFIRPNAEEVRPFDPEYTIINACKVVDEDWQKHKLNSEVFVAFNTEKKVAIIGGTWYVVFVFSQTTHSNTNSNTNTGTEEN